MKIINGVFCNEYYNFDNNFTISTKQNSQKIYTDCSRCIYKKSKFCTTDFYNLKNSSFKNNNISYLQ